MKPVQAPVLLLDGKEINIASIGYQNGEKSKVSYFDEEGNYHTLFDKKFQMDGYESVEDLESKVIFKDDSKNKIVQAIEDSLSDEEKRLRLYEEELADTVDDLFKGNCDIKRLFNCYRTRQEQLEKVDGIYNTLSLVKLVKG